MIRNCIIGVVGLACLAGGGCKSAATQVLLEVDAEDAALVDVTHVRVRRITTEGTFEQQESITERGTFPFVQPLQPDGDDEIIVTVALLQEGVERSEKTIRTRFTDGERRYVRVVFEAACAGVSCGAQSCLDGECVDSCVDTLPEPPLAASPPVECAPCGPSEAEGCDGFDNDCDGDVDEGEELPTACVGPGEATVHDNFQNANSDYIRVSDVLVETETSFVGVYAYLAPTLQPSTQELRAVVYSDEDGQPGELVASGERTNVSISEGTWVRASLDVRLVPGRYWIGLHTGAFEGVLTYANSEDPELASAFLALASFDEGAPERASWNMIERRLTGFLERAPGL